MSGAAGHPAISVRGLRKSYGDHEAVKGIDLDVKPGDVFGFLGPNGAGKTTTIEILEGYRPRTAGEVSVLGVDPARPSREWRERVGLVLQSCELEPLLTLGETMALYASFYERPRPTREVIELVGLDGELDTRIAHLSGGQRRRADVGLALIGDPDLVFLDEPTTGFDPTARRGAWSMIEGLKRLGKTVFLTTHYMEEAQRLSDRVAILRDGEIVAAGAPDELGVNGDASTVISFRLPAGTTLETVREALDAPAEPDGSFVRLETDDAQRALYRLLSWADRGGVRLEGIEVRKPDLEDVFVALTGSRTGE